MNFCGCLRLCDWRYHIMVRGHPHRELYHRLTLHGWPLYDSTITSGFLVTFTMTYEDSPSLCACYTICSTAV